MGNYATPGDDAAAARDYMLQQMQFLQFNPQSQDDQNEMKIKMQKNYLDITQKLLNHDQSQQLEQSFGITNKKELFVQAINFFTPYAYDILKNLDENQSMLSFENVTLQTSNLFFDADSMWHLWYPTTDELETQEVTPGGQPESIMAKMSGALKIKAKS